MADLTGKVKALIDSVRGKLTNTDTLSSGGGPKKRLGYRNVPYERIVINDMNEPRIDEGIEKLPPRQ